MLQEIDKMIHCADIIMAETGCRFSDVAQVAAKISEQEPPNNYVIIIQKKTKKPALVAVTETLLQTVAYIIENNLKIERLSYTTMRARKIKNYEFGKIQGRKKLTITSKYRHNKAKTLNNEEVMIRLGINEKTANIYKNSDFLF